MTVKKKTKPRRKKKNQWTLLSEKMREIDKQDPGIMKCIWLSAAAMLVVFVIYISCGAPVFAYSFLAIIPIAAIGNHWSVKAKAKVRKQKQQDEQPDNYEPQASKLFNNYLQKLPNNRRMSMLQSMREELNDD